MATILSPAASIVGSPSKVELTRTQAYAILDNLSLLAYDAHKNDKLSYTQVSITLGTNSSVVRKSMEWGYYLVGSGVTTDIVSLLPLIKKVHQCIIKNKTILEEYSERNSCIGKVDKAVQGLEALKINQYAGYEKKQQQVEESIEVLKKAKTLLGEKQAESTKTYLEEIRLRRLEDEARQKEKDELIARLEQENRTLRAQAAAAGNNKDLSSEQLISLAQDCLTLASSKMKVVKVREADSLRKTTT
jgi:hypothetical protein